MNSASAVAVCSLRRYPSVICLCLCISWLHQVRTDLILPARGVQRHPGDAKCVTEILGGTK